MKRIPDFVRNVKRRISLVNMVGFVLSKIKKEGGKKGRIQSSIDPIRALHVDVYILEKLSDHRIPEQLKGLQKPNRGINHENNARKDRSRSTKKFFNDWVREHVDKLLG